MAELLLSLPAPMSVPDVLANLPPAPAFPVFAPFRVFAPVSTELTHPEMGRLAVPVPQTLHLPAAPADAVDFPLGNAGAPSLEAWSTPARADTTRHVGKSPVPAQFAPTRAAPPAAVPAAASKKAVHGQFAVATPRPRTITGDAGKWGEKTHAAVVIASIVMVWWMFYGGWTEAARASLFGNFSAFWPLKLAAFVLVANFARRAGLAFALRLILAHAPRTPREGRGGKEANLAARLQQLVAQLGAQGKQPEPAELHRQIESINRGLREEALALFTSLKEPPAQLSARLRAATGTIAREAAAKALARAGRPGFGHR